jgi:hypothetical protein
MQLTKPLQNYFSFNFLYVLLAIVVIYALALTIEFKFIFTDEFYKHSLSKSESYDSYEKIVQFINKDRQTEWVNYPFIFIIVLVPAITISSVLFLGFILKEYQVSFKSIFSVVIKAQIVFAINYMIAVVLRILGLIKYDFNNVNNNYQYQSALVFFKIEKIPEWMYLPLQNINLTEIIYLMVLSFGMSKLIELKYLKTLGIVSLYYSLGLIFWFVLVIFMKTMF